MAIKLSISLPEWLHEKIIANMGKNTNVSSEIMKYIVIGMYGDVEEKAPSVSGSAVGGKYAVSKGYMPQPSALPKGDVEEKAPSVPMEKKENDM